MEEKRFPPEGELVVDLREPYAFECGSIPGSVNIPLSDIRRLYTLPRDKRLCVVCQIGEISQEIAELLRDAGYDAYSLEGGWRWYCKTYLAPKAAEALE